LPLSGTIETIKQNSWRCQAISEAVLKIYKFF